MKSFFITAIIAMMALISADAQRVQIVDNKGRGIPLVSVLTEDGNLIGTTDLDGMVADMKGASRIAVTHVAYKPQLVTLSSLPSASSAIRITMEDQDYNLDEIVIKPKQYIYIETNYRACVYRNDSLVYFKCGIMPNAHAPKTNKTEHGSSYQAYAEYAPTMGFAINWGSRHDVTAHPGCVRIPKEPIEDLMKNKYMVKVTQKDPNHRVYSNPEGPIGNLICKGNQARMTLDGSKMQMYANKVNGQTKMLERRQEQEYEYQYTMVYKKDETENYGTSNFVMNSDVWGYNDKKSHVTIVVETYATEHGYMDKNEFKAKKNEIKTEYKGSTLDTIDTYASMHNIPALSPTLRQAIMKLKKQ